MKINSHSFLEKLDHEHLFYDICLFNKQIYVLKYKTDFECSLMKIKILLNKFWKELTQIHLVIARQLKILVSILNDRTLEPRVQFKLLLIIYYLEFKFINNNMKRW